LWSVIVTNSPAVPAQLAVIVTVVVVEPPDVPLPVASVFAGWPPVPV
jgi:hypothetical protein